MGNSIGDIKRLKAAAVIAAVAIWINIVARKVESFSEWYNQNVYEVIVNILGRISNRFQICLIEFIIVIVIGIVIKYLYIRIKLILKEKENRDMYIKNYLLETFSKSVLCVTIIFLIITLNCATNYQRENLEDILGFENRKFNVDELEEVCIYYRDLFNKNSEKILKDSNGLCVLEKDAPDKAVVAMKNLTSQYKVFDGYYVRPKAVNNSYILSFCGLTGIFSAFTMEPNYNNDMPDFYKPFTMCHEMAHLRGIMKEEEANFIGIKACIDSGVASFEYSASALAYIYCINELSEVAPDEALKIKSGLNTDAKAEMRNNSLFWNKYQGKVSESYDKFNDAFLKANSQGNGIESYGDVVELLLMDYFKKNGS